MQFKNVAISLFVAAAAASDDVTTLLTQVPDCALTCLITGASDIGCTVTDYTCQCSKAAELQASAGPCIDSACSTADQETALTISQEICEAVGITADTTSVGSSSNSTATATSMTSSTATGTSSSSTSAVTAGAGRLELGALAAGAAVFAFAL